MPEVVISVRTVYDGSGMEAAEAGLSRIGQRAQAIMAGLQQEAASAVANAAAAGAQMVVKPAWETAKPMVDGAIESEFWSAGKAALDFSYAMNHVAAKLGENAKQIEYFHDGLMDAAPTLGRSLPELPQGLAEGVPPDKAIRLLDVSPDLVAAGNADLPQIAGVQGSSPHSRGTNGQEAGQFAGLPASAGYQPLTARQGVSELFLDLAEKEEKSKAAADMVDGAESAGVAKALDGLQNMRGGGIGKMKDFIADSQAAAPPPLAGDNAPALACNRALMGVSPGEAQRRPVEKTPGGMPKAFEAVDEDHSEFMGQLADANGAAWYPGISLAEKPAAWLSAETGKFIDHLGKKQVVLHFFGEGSSRLPISEKIAEIEGKLHKLGGHSEHTIHFLGDDGHSISFPMSRLQDGFSLEFDSLSPLTGVGDDSFAAYRDNMDTMPLSGGIAHSVNTGAPQVQAAAQKAFAAIPKEMQAAMTQAEQAVHEGMQEISHAIEQGITGVSSFVSQIEHQIAVNIARFSSPLVAAIAQAQGNIKQ